MVLWDVDGGQQSSNVQHSSACFAKWGEGDKHHHWGGGGWKTKAVMEMMKVKRKELGPGGENPPPSFDPSITQTWFSKRGGGVSLSQRFGCSPNFTAFCSMFSILCCDYYLMILVNGMYLFGWLWWKKLNWICIINICHFAAAFIPWQTFCCCVTSLS